MVVYRAENSVAIGFDDGPNPKVTPQILDILKSKGIKATFFLIALRAEQFPEIVKRIAEEGHEIGNHSYTHKPLARLLKEKGQKEIQGEIYKAHDSLKHLAGISDNELRLFRPPYLDWDQDTAELARPLYGDRIIMTRTGMGDYAWGNHEWDETDLDGINNQAQSMRDSLLSTVKNGSIIGLHDGAEYSLPGNKEFPNWQSRSLPTLKALPQIIDALLDKNLIIKKLSDLDLIFEPIVDERHNN